MTHAFNTPLTLDIGIDIGGTFTDVVKMGSDGSISVTKGLSTPQDQSVGALAAVEKLGRPLAEVRNIIHGTTVATNAILERQGARLVLVTTRGFRDVLELQRQERRNIWDLYIRKVAPLVPREMRLELEERISSDGSIVTPVSADALADLTVRIKALGAEAVAISFINAYVNEEHERIVEDHLHNALPGVFVTRSSHIAPHFREYERTSTTAISAYVGPKLSRYLDRFEDRFAGRDFAGGIFVMGSNGGVLPIGRTSAHAGTTCLSGPAGGVLATQRLAREKGVSNLISFDMGGTSTDVCVIANGAATVSTAFQIDGLPITLPMFAIETVSAGGGSIAWIDAGGMLQVGPQSAGSEPGPACYGRGGTQPTVTDALCLLGLIRPETFFGGALPLAPEAAEATFAALASQLDCTPEETAVMTLRIANARMANAVRLVTVREGHDPRDFALVAFGGAGALHACHVAEEIGINHVIVPRFPGAFSAFGLLSANIRRDFLKAWHVRLSQITEDDLRTEFAALHAQALPEMSTMAQDRAVTWTLHADLRYHGQASELLVPVEGGQSLAPDALAAAFHDQHRAKYGYYEQDAELELINLRLTGWVVVENAPLPDFPVRAAAVPTLTRLRSRWPGNPTLGFCERDELCAGDRLPEGTVIGEATATTFAPTGWTLEVDAKGHFDLRHIGDGR